PTLPSPCPRHGSPTLPARPRSCRLRRHERRSPTGRALPTIVDRSLTLAHLTSPRSTFVTHARAILARHLQLPWPRRPQVQQPSMPEAMSSVELVTDLTSHLSLPLH